MGTIHGTYIDGRIIPDTTPPHWSDGRRVRIEDAEDRIGMTEEEQGDDPESIAHWMAAFDAIPVATSSPLDDPAVLAWREAMRRHNVEAVRKHMQDTPE